MQTSSSYCYVCRRRWLPALSKPHLRWRLKQLHFLLSTTCWGTIVNLWGPLSVCYSIFVFVLPCVLICCFSCLSILVAVVICFGSKLITSLINLINSQHSSEITTFHWFLCACVCMKERKRKNRWLLTWLRILITIQALCTITANYRLFQEIRCFKNLCVVRIVVLPKQFVYDLYITMFFKCVEMLMKKG